MIRTVESAYSHAQRHSDALEEICQDLEEEYECRFIEPFESVFRWSKYVAVCIYDRVLLVKVRNSQ